MEYFRHGTAAFTSKGYVHPYVEAHRLELQTSAGNLFKNPTYLEFYETELEKRLYEEEEQRKRKVRQEQAARIRESLNAKREEKKLLNHAELGRLEVLLGLKDADPDTFRQQLESLELDSQKELEKKIKQLKIKLGIISKAEVVGL